MNTAETITLLKMRSGYTSQPYGEQTVAQWLDALETVPFTTAQEALTRAAKRTNRVALADVIAELPQRRLEDANATPTVIACGCTHTGTICDTHRRIGLAAIAAIRAERADKGAT